MKNMSQILPPKGRKIAVVAAIVLAAFLSFLAWDHYMKTTWDHHIATDLRLYELQKKGEETSLSLSDEEVSLLSKRHNIPTTLEIIKTGKEYFIVQNGHRQKVTKTTTNESALSDLQFPKEFEWVVFSTGGETEVIEILVNIHEVWGCRGIKSNWTGNLDGRKILDNGNVLRYSGHANVYENVIQYFLCRFYPYRS